MDYIEILDRLTEATMEIRELEEAPPPRVEKERILQLKFKRGQKVRDKVTGQEGVIIDAGTQILQV